VHLDVSFLPPIAAAFLLIFARTGTMVMLLPGLGEQNGMNAPLCVAKGVDLIARKIREVAEAHGIPVVENPPLARALHGTVEIDQEIPQEHYRAVAEIIGYLMRLRRLVAR